MMHECICCQCEETTGQFKNFRQCESCSLFGNEDEFDKDTVCNSCNRRATEPEEQLKNFLGQLRKTEDK